MDYDDSNLAMLVLQQRIMLIMEPKKDDKNLIPLYKVERTIDPMTLFR